MGFLINPYVFGGTADTTPDGKQAFLVIGDSIAKGTNSGTTGAGPTPTSGTAYYYARSEATKIQEIVASDLVLADVANRPNNGSPWPNFAINHYNNTGKKAVIIPTGVGSSSFAFQADGSANWDPAEVTNLYDVAVADANDALNELGLTKLKGIIINLGVNDARQTTDLADFEAAADRFFAQIQIDFPNTEILVAQCGRDETATGTASVALGRVRKKLKSICENNTNCFIHGFPLAMHAAGLIGTDNIHPTQPGNNSYGEALARFFNNSSISNKWARSIVSSHFDDLNANRISLIESLVTNDVDDYLDHEVAINTKTTTRNNVFVDWSFLNVPIDSGFDFTANSHIASDGTTNKYFRSGYIPAWVNYRSSQNDIFIAQKILQNDSGVGSTGTALGYSNASSVALNITQTPGGLTYRVDDFTATSYGGETRFADDAEYMASRNGTTKALHKNATQVSSATVSSTGTISGQQFNGAINSNTVTLSTLAIKMEFIRGGKFSTVGQSAFYTVMEYLIDHWND